MRRLVSERLIILLVTATSAAACGSGSTSTVPTVPTPAVTTTDTFNGTLNINGAVIHPFATVASGTVTATLTTLAPDSTVQIGLSLGTWNGSACSVQIDNASATQGAVISGTVSGAINLCVRIYDAAAKLTGPETYTITVVHP